MGNREGILWRILHRENIKGRRRREDVLNRARLKVGEIKNTKGVERFGIRRIFCHSQEFLEGGFFSLIIIISLLLQKNWHFMRFDKKTYGPHVCIVINLVF